MMYQERLAIAVKTNGKVLREQGDTVFVPFGSEYTLYIKNMHSLRALVRIEIDGTDGTDGTDATEGTSLIVPANGSIEIERFIKAGNFDKGQRFKFIERTSKIENGPRGIKTEDGLIRVEFEFEREPIPMKNFYYVDPTPIWTTYPKKEVHHHHHYDLYSQKLGSSSPTVVSDQLARGATYSSGDAYNGDAQCSLTSTAFDGAVVMNASNSISGSTASVNSFTASAAPEAASSRTLRSMSRSAVKMKGFAVSAAACEEPENDKGITVGGSVSDQKFVTGSWFPTDGVKHVMIIRILGAVGEKKVSKPVTVKTKQECPTCGTKSKAGSRFCKECGTGLVDV